MTIKYKAKTVIDIDVSSLERFIELTYGHEFEMRCDLEVANETSKEFNMMKKEELDDYDKEELDEFIATGKGSYISLVLLQDLVNKEHLPEGDFIIDLSW